MRKIWFVVAIISAVLFAYVSVADAQQATAYATVLIIVPERSDRPAETAEATEEEKDEESTFDESLNQQTALAKGPKEDIKTSE